MYNRGTVRHLRKCETTSARAAQWQRSRPWARYARLVQTSAAAASPKSISLSSRPSLSSASPTCSSMFDGLISRWTTSAGSSSRSDRERSSPRRSLSSRGITYAHTSCPSTVTYWLRTDAPVSTPLSPDHSAAWNHANSNYPLAQHERGSRRRQAVAAHEGRSSALLRGSRRACRRRS